MTIVYKIATRHTKEVLLDFIRFTYRVNHPKSTFRLCIMGTGFLLLAMYLMDQPQVMIPCIVGGLLLILFAFTRHRIAFARLSKSDENYKNQTVIGFEFGHSEFRISKTADSKEMRYRYGEITRIYKDKRNYYLLLNEEEVQVIPWSSFDQGNAAEFEEFIIHKIAKPIYDLNVTLKERLELLNQKRKMAEDMHDKKNRS